MLKDEIDRIVSRVKTDALADDCWTHDYTSEILSLIEPELEKARKWGRIVILSDGDCNTDCPLFNNNHDKHTSLCTLKPNNMHCLFTDVVVLLDGKEVKDAT
jgi:hypothetical protein